MFKLMNYQSFYLNLSLPANLVACLFAETQMMNAIKYYLYHNEKHRLGKKVG